MLIDTTAYRTQNHGLCLVIAKFRFLFTGPKLLIRHKKSGNTEPDSKVFRARSAFLLLLIVLKKQKTKMVWSYISQLSNNKTGHFFHLTSLKFSDMKKADTFGLRNSLFMAFFSLQYSITRKVGCCFSVKKSWDFNFLLSFFLFFFKTCDHF